ncbi:hypothetical protein Rhal01_02225 [Rubritalea halochordaticola]|uniref:DUF4190 domain-containing protein n=1 Tax=Rubritalea halochordaticola TaxID=714537 RepID=A0ABP9V296_9BACT
MSLHPAILGTLLVVAMFVCSLIGVVVVITGRKDKKTKLAGIGLIAGPWILVTLVGVLLTFISPGIDEWNPSIESDSQTLGTWQGDSYTITLKADHTFTADLNSQHLSGTWSRDDWNLTLIPREGEQLLMRFVEESDELLLLPTPPEEPGPPGPITRKNK